MERSSGKRIKVAMWSKGSIGTRGDRVQESKWDKESMVKRVREGPMCTQGLGGSKGQGDQGNKVAKRMAEGSAIRERSHLELL